MQQRGISHVNIFPLVLSLRQASLNRQFYVSPYYVLILLWLFSSFHVMYFLFIHVKIEWSYLSIKNHQFKCYSGRIQLLCFLHFASNLHEKQKKDNWFKCVVTPFSSTLFLFCLFIIIYSSNFVVFFFLMMMGWWLLVDWFFGAIFLHLTFPYTMLLVGISRILQSVYITIFIESFLSLTFLHHILIFLLLLQFLLLLMRYLAKLSGSWMVNQIVFSLFVFHLICFGFAFFVFFLLSFYF